MIIITHVTIFANKGSFYFMNQKYKKELGAVETVKRIWGNYASGLSGYLYLALFCNAIVAISTPALPELIRRVIDDIFIGKDQNMLVILPVVAVIIMLIRAIGTYGANVSINVIGQRLVGSLQEDLYNSLLKADLAYINSIHSARFISNFTADSTKLRETMSSVVVNLSRNILMVLGLMGYLFWVEPNLAVIFILVLPPAAIGLRILGRKLRKAIRQSLEEIGTLSSLVSETLRGMRIIKAYRKENVYSEKAIKIIKKVVSLSMKGVRARSASAPIMEMVTGFAIAGIIYYSGNKSIDGSMSVGSFMAFTTAAGLLYDPLKAVANLQAMLQEGVAASQRLFPILDNNPTIVDNLKTKEIIDSRGELEFVNVSFSYPNTHQYVLKNVSLRIMPGETVALVGPSGAGKSTLLNLVPRFYDSTEGTVKIDKIDVKDLSLESVRDSSSLVTQDALIFDTSVRENIMFGAKGVDEDVFMSVCKETLVDEFVKEFPDGYETVVGEGGVKISGGQRQRIAIARALITNPEFIVLDEPTSALDVSVQAQILNLLKQIKKDMNLTYLFVSHDLSVVKHISDRIAIMYLGKIVELSNTEELFNEPKHPYTQALLSSIPSTESKKMKKIILKGEVPSPINPPKGCHFHPRCEFKLDKCDKTFPKRIKIDDSRDVACYLYE